VNVNAEPGTRVHHPTRTEMFVHLSIRCQQEATKMAASSPSTPTFSSLQQLGQLLTSSTAMTALDTSERQ